MVESNYYSFKMNLKILERKIRIINEANLACRKLSLTRSRSTPAFDLESFPYLKVPEISHVLIKDYLVDMLPKKNSFNQVLTMNAGEIKKHIFQIFCQIIVGSDKSTNLITDIIIFK